MSKQENQISEDEIRLTGQVYKLRCLECERKTSKAGNPMLVQKFEITDASKIIQDGIELDINGVTIMNFAVLTDRSLGAVNNQRKALGLPPVTLSEMDKINPLDYIGATGFATCVSKSEEDKSTDKEPVIDPYTGKPAITWQKNINKWFYKKD